jgi:hypothetical protein
MIRGTGIPGIGIRGIGVAVIILAIIGRDGVITLGITRVMIAVIGGVAVTTDLDMSPHMKKSKNPEPVEHIKQRHTTKTVITAWRFPVPW